MDDVALQTVYRSVVIAKLTYASKDCLLVYACLFYHPFSIVTLLRYVSIELKELLTYLLYFKEIRVSKIWVLPSEAFPNSGLRDDFAMAHHLLPCVVSNGSATVMCSSRLVSSFVYSAVGVTQRIARVCWHQLRSVHKLTSRR